MATSRLTHLALPVTSVDRSAAFYQRWASMEVTNGIRETTGAKMAGLTDPDRSFVLVLIETASVQPLGGAAHLGVSCDSDDEVARRAEEAKREGCLTFGPSSRPAPLGFSAFLTDPDGHQLELYHGQHAGIAGA